MKKLPCQGSFFIVTGKCKGPFYFFLQHCPIFAKRLLRTYSQVAGNVHQILVYNEPWNSKWQWCQTQVASVIASPEFAAAWGHVKISTPFLGGVAGQHPQWLTDVQYEEKHPVSFQPYPYSDSGAGVISLGYDVSQKKPVPSNGSLLEIMVNEVQKKVKTGKRQRP